MFKFLVRIQMDKLRAQLSRTEFPKGVFFKENPLMLIGYMLLSKDHVQKWILDIPVKYLPGFDGKPVLGEALESVNFVYNKAIEFLNKEYNNLRIYGFAENFGCLDANFC